MCVDDILANIVFGTLALFMGLLFRPRRKNNLIIPKKAENPILWLLGLEKNSNSETRFLQGIFAVTSLIFTVAGIYMLARGMPHLVILMMK